MIIYKTTNKINGKIYVGKYEGSKESYLGSGKVLWKAIKKYGVENFARETLEVCNNRSELNKREIFWIKELGARNNNIGYNITSGGDWGDMITAHPDRLLIIDKISDTITKYCSTEKGKKQRSDSSKKMWDNPNYVQKQRDAQKAAQNKPETKLNKSINGKIAQNTPEAKKRKSLELKKRWQKAKLITCEYCNFSSINKGAMNRYHHQKCKRKNDRKN